jgi:hypothetical protein
MMIVKKFLIFIRKINLYLKNVFYIFNIIYFIYFSEFLFIFNNNHNTIYLIIF